MNATRIAYLWWIVMVASILGICAAGCAWVGALGNGGLPAPNGGGWRLDPGASNRLAIDDGWGGRSWGRRGRHFDDQGIGACATGDCGGTLACNGARGAPPTSLAELTLDGTGNFDFYDLSLVDGFDLPIQIAPSPPRSQPDDKYRCGIATCAVDLVSRCPPSLQKRDASGLVVACLGAYDDVRSTYTCGHPNPDSTITFCPKEPS